MKLDSAVNNLQCLKRFGQNLKRTIAEKILYMHKSYFYVYQTQILSPACLKMVNQMGTEI